MLRYFSWVLDWIALDIDPNRMHGLRLKQRVRHFIFNENHII